MGNSVFAAAQKLEKEKKWIDAATLYEQLLSISPTIENYEKAAWCFSRAEEYDKAIEYCLKLHELEPRSAKWLYMIGYQYYSQFEWKTAIEWFEKALEQDPDYFVAKYRIAYAYNQLAGSYMQLKKAEYWKARGHLEDCHRLWASYDDLDKQKEHTTYFGVNFLHGKMLMNLPQHYSEAINLFQAALNIVPTHVHAKYNLAKVYYSNGDFRKAKENLPAEKEFYIDELKAKIDTQLGDYQEAISIYKELLTRRKKDYLYTLLAETYMLNNEPEKAYKASQQAIKLGNRNHKNYYVMAQVYYHYGLLDKAIEDLELASELKYAKYKASYNEADELKEKILREKPYDYKDNTKLIEKLVATDMPPAKPSIEQSEVCYYNSDKGYGFIKRDPNNIFFHISDCKYSDIAEGDVVEFSTINRDRGLNAVDIKKID